MAVIAPSGPCEHEPLERGLARLEQRYVLERDPRVMARKGYLAGDDAQRAAALLDALRDRSVRAIVCARGGYGTMRMLEIAGDAITQALRDDPKPLVGFSDVTALHALWARARVRSYHAPMVGAIGSGRARECDVIALFDALEGRGVPGFEALSSIATGRAEGMALGGNLALLAALAGTPYALPMDDSLLFLEDVGERPYRLDRMLTQLRLSGALSHVRAIVLGEFLDCDPARDGVTAEEVFADRLGDLHIPVLLGAPFGHGTAQAVIPFGACARVENDGSVHFAL